MKKTLISAGSVLLISALTTMMAAPASAAEGDVDSTTSIVQEQILEDQNASPVDESSTDENTPAAPVETPAPEAEDTPVITPPAPAEEITPPVESEEPPMVAPDHLAQAHVSFTATDRTATVEVSPAYPAEEAIELYTVTLTSDTDGYNVVKTRPTAGLLTFDGLTPNTAYNLNVRTDAGSMRIFQERAFSTLHEAPARPSIVETTVGAGQASITFEAGAVAGPVGVYTAVVASSDNETTVSQERTDAGTFNFTGLAPGLYSYSVTAEGPGGIAGVSDNFFVIPSTPAAPMLTISNTETDSLTLIITPANPTTLPKNTTVASVDYTVVLDNGTKKVTETLTNLYPTAPMYHVFESLNDDSDYTFAVTATNVAGTSDTSVLVARTAAEDPETPVTPVTPEAPAQDSLQDATRGEIVVPTQGVIGDSVTVNVGVALAGQYINGWLFSSPTALGQALVGADGMVTFTIPTSLPAGAHRLAITDTSNALIGWGNIQVASPAAVTPGDTTPVVTDPAVTVPVNVAAVDNSRATANQSAARQLAVTGSDAPWALGLWALAFIAGGAVLLTFRRRGVATK